jgi:hypothetical protein
VNLIIMKEKILIFITGLLGVLATAILMSAPVIADALEDFLNIKKAVVKVDDDQLDSEIKTNGHISTNGEEGAFGYAIITDKGLDALIVTTSHAGVLDSKEQDDANDPIFHNHYVALDDNSKECGDDPKIEKITYQSPGKVDIEKRKALLENIPLKFEGTNVDRPGTEKHDIELGEDIKFKAGTDVQDVVSFKLDPKFDGDKIKAICVTDIEPAEDVKAE